VRGAGDLMELGRGRKKVVCLTGSGRGKEDYLERWERGREDGVYPKEGATGRVNVEGLVRRGRAGGDGRGSAATDIDPAYAAAEPRRSFLVGRLRSGRTSETRGVLENAETC